MAVWRRKLIELLAHDPERDWDAESEVTIGSAMLGTVVPALEAAYDRSDAAFVASVWGFVVWCLGQSELWHDTGLLFMAGSSGSPRILRDLPRYVEPRFYEAFRDHLRAKLNDEQAFLRYDRYYRAVRDGSEPDGWPPPAGSR